MDTLKPGWLEHDQNKDLRTDMADIKREFPVAAVGGADGDAFLQRERSRGDEDPVRAAWDLFKTGEVV